MIIGCEKSMYGKVGWCWGWSFIDFFPLKMIWWKLLLWGLVSQARHRHWSHSLPFLSKQRRIIVSDNGCGWASVVCFLLSHLWCSSINPTKAKLKNRVYKPFNSKRVRKCINEPNIMGAFIMQAKYSSILIMRGQKSKARYQQFWLYKEIFWESQCELHVSWQAGLVRMFFVPGWHLVKGFVLAEKSLGCFDR